MRRTHFRGWCLHLVYLFLLFSSHFQRSDFNSTINWISCIKCAQIANDSTIKLQFQAKVKNHCNAYKMSDVSEEVQSKSKFYAVLPILLCGLSIPLSLFLWLGNLAFTILTNKSSASEGMFSYYNIVKSQQINCDDFVLTFLNFLHFIR